MSDKDRFHLPLRRTEFIEKRRLEFEDAVRAVHELRHLRRAFGLPSPDLWDDVVQDRDAQLADFLREAEVEARVVNADQRRGAFLLHAVQQLVKDPPEEPVALG